MTLEVFALGLVILRFGLRVRLGLGLDQLEVVRGLQGLLRHRPYLLQRLVRLVRALVD